MDYFYTVIYQLEGVSDKNLVEDKIVYQDAMRGTTVLLTRDINRHCLNIDTGLACASLLLRGMFNNERLAELSTAIDAEIEKIQNERTKKKTGAYAVIVINGKAELKINDKLHRETDRFRLCFDAIDKSNLREINKYKIHSIVSALSMCTSPEYHSEMVASGIYFVDEKDKLLFSLTLSGGRARLILSKPLDTEKQSEITKIIGLTSNNQQLKTPFRLFAQSLEATQDNLRSFISAWTALEIFTNKVFSNYEERFIAGIADEHSSHGVSQFLARIKVVMKDKYRLSDKFALIASFLSDDVEEDIELFRSLKDLRDDISHGNEFNEETLPIESVRKLAAKYLRSHILLTENA